MKINRAFTLFEMLIASSIFVVLMLTIYSAFRTGLFSYRNIDETIDIYHSARQILERIDLDLRNSFAYSKDETKFTGKKNEIGFLSLVDTFTEDRIIQDYALVSYRIEGNKLMRLCRKNQEALNQKSEIEWQELGSHIEEITFSYGDLISADQHIEWKDLWDDTQAFPVAVKVRLTLKDKTRRIFERTVYLII